MRISRRAQAIEPFYVMEVAKAASELALPAKFNAYVMTRAKDNVATIYQQLP